MPSACERQQWRIEPVDLGCRLARPQQRHAGLTSHGVGHGVDLANTVETVERKHDLAVLRDLPADEAGIAALRDDRGPGLVRKLEDFRDLGDRSRPQHHRARPAKHVARLGEIGRLRLSIGYGVFASHDRHETG